MIQTVNAFGYLTQPLAIVYGQAQQKKINKVSLPPVTTKAASTPLTAR